MTAPTEAPTREECDAMLKPLHGEHGSGLVSRLYGAQRLLDARKPISGWVAAEMDNEAARWILDAAALLIRYRDAAHIPELDYVGWGLLVKPPIKHLRGCRWQTNDDGTVWRGPGDDDCTCSYEWRVRLSTAMTMHNAWRKRAEEAETALNAIRDAAHIPREPLQQRVQPWMLACFGAQIAADKSERNHRFIEESLELVQACGCTASESHQLVDYVFGRPKGDAQQEVGGVMITLAALCLANGFDMHESGERELARIWTKVDQIRAKQAAKPPHSPLPSAEPAHRAIEPPRMTENPAPTDRNDPAWKTWKLHNCPDGSMCRAHIPGGCATDWCAEFGVSPEATNGSLVDAKHGLAGTTRPARAAPPASADANGKP